MTYAVGSLVRARGREWVVLPDSSDDMLYLRPLGGTDDEIAGVFTALESVEPATFSLPDPDQIGDHRSARLLRDAVRLGFRSSAGPFRSFASINVEPRPYQLVPLLMALKQDPVRLLIGDDVGIGKTVEALLIARELLDRGEIKRIAVLCPPQLAEQWQAEMQEKFYIDAVLVLSSTATRLERGLRLGESLFDHHPFVVISTDFIKSERRRAEFLRTAPEFIIVDEAHTAAHTLDGRGRRHQRFELVKGLSEKPERHMVLVTATPHSGKEAAFRSLLSILKDEFAELPDDLTGPAQESTRRELSRYFIQRRRGDIKKYADEATFFPDREFDEATYTLSPKYEQLFEQVIAYARETVHDPEEEAFRQRVRWWSALALLRALASSPAAAAATLRNRAASAEADNAEDADEIGRRTVLDLMEEDAAEGIDVTPGSQIGDVATNPQRHARRLKALAKEAEALKGKEDYKLQKAIDLIKGLISDGYSPIVFCRFIDTVDYVVKHLRDSSRGVEIAGITGSLPPSEREQRVQQLVKHEKRVLVCTDCLSEGINLQGGFNAVMHYDLSWNPTRHEQREGRVDRYGQSRKQVKIVTYYGIDNQIDGIVLEVLLRKHETIRNSLGISVPIPGDPNQIAEAIIEGLLLREERVAPEQMVLTGFEEYLEPRQIRLLKAWDDAAEREKISRTMFAQHRIKVDEVMRELEAARQAIGSGVIVKDFMVDAVRMHKGFVSPNGAVAFDLEEAPRGLREMLGSKRFKADFKLPVDEGVVYLTRTHPLVEATASYVMDTALDPLEDSAARRAGVVRTQAVRKMTTLLLIRFRYHIITIDGDMERQLLAEDSELLAFEGLPEDGQWLDSEAAEALLASKAAGNITHAEAQERIERVEAAYDEHILPHLEAAAQARGEKLLDAHRRVRSESHRKGVRYRIEPQLPPDVLGIYVFLPAGGLF